MSGCVKQWGTARFMILGQGHSLNPYNSHNPYFFCFFCFFFFAFCLVFKSLFLPGNQCHSHFNYKLNIFSSQSNNFSKSRLSPVLLQKLIVLLTLIPHKVNKSLNIKSNRKVGLMYSILRSL